MKKILLFFLLLISTCIYSQSEQIKITGKVFGVKGEPLPGVNIISSEKKSTTTDIDGKYTISVSNKKITLTYTHEGFLPQYKSVGNQTEININLLEDKKELEEVVVVGYGTQRKKDVTVNFFCQY